MSHQQLVGELLQRVEAGAPAGWTHADTKLLGTLYAKLARSLRLPANRYSAQKSMLNLLLFAHHPDFSWQRLEGANCLEVGCGGMNPLGPLFAFLLAGARHGLALDLDDVEDLPSSTFALYECLTAALTGVAVPRIPGSADLIRERIASFDVDKLYRGEPTGIDPERLLFRRCALAEAGLPPASIDVVVTNSFFEHVPDPAAIAAQFADVCRPGSLAVHAIDGADHMRYANPAIGPLKFLAAPTGPELFAGCNRLRPLQYREIFEQVGFEVRRVTETERITLQDADVARFAPAFRALDRDTLEVVGARFFLRRR